MDQKNTGLSREAAGARGMSFKLCIGLFLIRSPISISAAGEALLLGEEQPLESTS